MLLRRLSLMDPTVEERRPRSRSLPVVNSKHVISLFVMDTLRTLMSSSFKGFG